MPTNGMTIDTLNTVSSLTAQDEVPVWDKEASGEPTKKITAQNMANSVKTLGSLVNTTEMNTAIAQSTAAVKVKHEIITGTTTAGGALNLNMSPASRLVINVVSIDTDANYVCIVARSPGSQWVFVKRGTNMSIAANTNVTVDVFYIDAQ